MALHRVLVMNIRVARGRAQIDVPQRGRRALLEIGAKLIMDEPRIRAAGPDRYKTMTLPTALARAGQRPEAAHSR